LRLRQLFQPFINFQVTNAENPDVVNITTDSRDVEPGSLFVAVRGHTVDGHRFARQAVERGAVAVMVEEPVAEVPASIPQVVVPDTRHWSALVADRLFGSPSRELRVIGVTGTNGKTTVTHIVRHLLDSTGRKAGLIGTVGAKLGQASWPLPNTTPEAVEVHRWLRRFVDAGATHAVMEVSSHALVERRAAGVSFACAAFTNLTQDHLDFHGTMERYAGAKALLFSRLGNGTGDDPARSVYAVINADDPWSWVMAEASAAPILTYGMERAADVRARDVRLSASGARFFVDSPAGAFEIEMPLIGRFNVYNTLAAVAIALVEGLTPTEIQEGIRSYPSVPGRMERIDEGQPFSVFVDYAHTPDGLENVLASVREFAPARVLVVVGCGGDRDRTKRPKMAEVAVRLADRAIFTSDNPRSEDPVAILADMRGGVEPAYAHKVREEVDRRRAIEMAIAEAEPGDVVVIAGKGHEDYQIIGAEKRHFDDREEARRAIRARYGRN